MAINNQNKLAEFELICFRDGKSQTESFELNQNKSEKQACSPIPHPKNGYCRRVDFAVGGNASIECGCADEQQIWTDKDLRRILEMEPTNGTHFTMVCKDDFQNISVWQTSKGEQQRFEVFVKEGRTYPPDALNCIAASSEIPDEAIF